MGNNVSGRSIVWTIIGVVLIVIRIARISSRIEQSNKRTDYLKVYKSQEKATKRAEERLLRRLEKKIRKKSANEMVIDNFHVDATRLSNTVAIDTTIRFNKNFSVVINSAFNTSVKKGNVPIVSSARGYYLIVEKIKKNKKNKLLEQWKSLRNQENQKTKITLYKSKQNSKKNAIIDVDYTVNINDLSFKGVGELIEIRNQRYFLHLLTRHDSKSYDYLHMYLHSYYKFKD